MKWGAVPQAGLKYTNKVSKIGFLYGLAGLVYFSVIYLSASCLGPHASRVWLEQTSLLLLMLGYALFFPMCILSFKLYTLLPSFDMYMFFILFPFTGTLLGAVCGFLMDLFGGNEEDGDEAAKEKEIFIRINLRKGRQIPVRNRSVDYCIIAGVILWILLAVSLFFLFAGVPKN